MKYYKIGIKRRFPQFDRVLGHANGQYVPNGKHYIDRMGAGEIIENAPVFDYFHLQSYGPKEEWEWRKQDVHGFIGAGSILTGLYISDGFKQLLVQFKIASMYHFYETKLLYKGEKFKYWIFQFPINPLQNYNYKKSEYFLDDNRILGLSNADEYDKYDYKIWKETKKSIEWKNIVLLEDFDIVKTMQNDTIVSKRLKEAIEKSGLEGFEFSELDYEVVVEE